MKHEMKHDLKLDMKKMKSSPSSGKGSRKRPKFNETHTPQNLKSKSKSEKV